VDETSKTGRHNEAGSEVGTTEMKLTTQQRKNLPKSDFADPAKAPGSGSFPLNDAKRVKAALSYIRYASPATAEKIHAKAKSMGIGGKKKKTYKMAERGKM
jgi:hypothetical protein